MSRAGSRVNFARRNKSRLWLIILPLYDRLRTRRDCNIEPPASPYAIMRRAYPYRGENSGPGKDDHWGA